jgi:hypothetical protein
MSDRGYGDRWWQPTPADLEKTNADAAKAANTKTADAFTVTKSDLNVVMNGKYQFSFAYLYSDPNNDSNLITGSRSPNFVVTLQAPDLTQPVTNLVVTPGLLSYTAKWDLIDKLLPANKWLIDIQIYESLTGAFAGEEYLVWNGNGNSATILVSNTANRWIRVDTRDQDFRKKSATYGPFKATDPIVVDTVGPDNVASVNTSDKGIDTSGYLGFNAYANISWPAVTGGGIRGYRIRFSNDNNATYSYVDSPGTGTTYKLAGLAIGSTYKIAVATYDEYNNTSSSYVSGSDVTVTGTPSVSNYISGGPFQFGVGVGSVSTNKGLYFDASNYWYVNATNSARLKVGGASSNYLLWDGSTFAVDGNITARGGQFSGNIYMTTAGASIYNGTIDATTGNLTGDGFALNSTGLKVASGVNSVTIAAATGTITANAGSIGGWNLSGTTLSKNNVILDSTGQIQVGSTAAQSVYLKSSGGFLMWAGNNTPDTNAKFRVAADGTLYATGAVIGGYPTDSAAQAKADAAYAAAVAAAATDATTKANTAKARADLAYDKAVAAADGSTLAAQRAQEAKDAVALKMAEGDINRVIGLNTTIINGDRVTTGTIDVARLNITGGNTTNGFAVDGNGIRGYSGGSQNLSITSSGVISMKGAITATSGKIAGFEIASNSDLYADTAVGPRILFQDYSTSNTIMHFGWESGAYRTGTYALIVGQDTTSAGSSFYVNTKTSRFRFAADSVNREYAAEIRNDVRARQYRYVTGGGLVNDNSSRRFKENITYMPPSYYNRILDINSAFYTYINNHPETTSESWGKHGFGPIAEDLEDAGLGLFVQRNLKGQPTSLINEHKLALLLIPIVKELKEKIQVMDQKILDLESK